MGTFTDRLRDGGESGLASLLAARPDLAAPPPSSVRSLAARASNRTSLDRALAGVDQRVLTLLEAVLALTGTVAEHADPVRNRSRNTTESSLDPGSVDAPTVDELVRATGIGVEDLTRAVDHAVRLALLWPDPDDDARLRAAPGLEEALGPYPAGLGPTLVSTLSRRSPAALSRLATELGVETGVGTGVETAEPDDAAHLTTDLARYLAHPANVEALLADAPPGAQAVLDALTWGPPVGRSPAASSPEPTSAPGAPGSRSAATGSRPGARSAADAHPPAETPSPARVAVDWLLRHGLLAVGDPQHVVLPREVALALRGGRTHRTTPEPPRPAGPEVDPRTADAESAHHASEAVRLVTALVAVWGEDPPPVLRSGGLGSRELRRLALRLEVTEPVAALVVEVAGAAGLVADDGAESPSLAPTVDVDDWLGLPLPQRWLVLADAWLDSERAAWLVGTRDDRGSLRAALDPEARRPWAPRLRRSVLGVLADAGSQAPVADQVHQVLRWRTPRSVAPVNSVAAVITEAGGLGVLGAGALGAAGHALLSGERFTSTDPDGAAPAEVLAGLLPPAVDDLLLQGDLTGIVPGRPSDELGALLNQVTEVESRGAALTVRFTEQSVRRGLDAGRTADELLAELARYARTGVPQPLEYLVLDAGRRHGRIRVGVASSYLRSDDPALLAGLTEDPALRGLGLLRLAPTVVAAQAPAAELLAALRDRGLAPVTEGPSGQVVVLASVPYRARRPRGAGRVVRPRPAGPPTGTGPAEERRLHRLARDLLAADRRENSGLARAAAASAAAQSEASRSGAARSAAAPAEGAQPGATPSDRVSTDRSDPTGTPDPVLSLALLREAVTEGREVWLEMVGTEGVVVRRKVRPVRVDAGRVRAVDTEREAELTVAVHRIATVTPA